MGGPTLKTDLATLNRRLEHLRLRVDGAVGESPSAQYDRAEYSALGRAITALERGGWDYRDGPEKQTRQQIAASNKWRLEQLAQRYRKELEKVEEVLQKEGVK